MGVETLALIGTGVSLLGAGVGAYSAIQQGEAQKSAADYQAAVDKNNATIAGYNADIAEKSAEQRTQAVMREGALRLGAQRAALGASGVDVDSGSAVDVQNATIENTTRAADASQEQGALTAYGFATQGQNFLDQSAMSTATGSNAASAGTIGVGTSLLSGATQVASRWYDYSLKTTPPRTAQVA